jgi:Amt family ammonium transporter
LTPVSGIVYPPISHWVWTEVGWLNTLGYVDFSGCGPVHLLGGVCSFVGAVFLGPRLGRFGNKYDDSEKEEIVGHSIPVRTKLTGSYLYDTVNSCQPAGNIYASA